MSSVILGIGTALPEHTLPTEVFIEHAKQFNCKSPKQERVLEELYRRTTIGSRCSVLSGCGYGATGERAFAPPSEDNQNGPSTAHRMQYYAAEVGRMAQEACKVALANSAVEQHQITHLVTASCTGFNAPGFDIELIHSLPLSRGTMRTHVGFMGCHGGMNALRAANAYALADSNATILVCAAEACSIHFQYGWGTHKLVANSLFSDGSAAFVVKAGHAGRLKVVSSASYLVPDSLDDMQWKIGDYGFEMRLSTSVPDVIERLLADWIDEWLSNCGFARDGITAWAVHPGGPKILDAVQNSLKLKDEDMEASRHILATCGNMSSPTVFFILQELMTQGRKGPCVVLGFGPGLTIEAALLHLQ